MWWFVTIVAVVLALLIQYICSSRILQLKQKVTAKSMSLREARFEGERLSKLSGVLQNQDVTLKQSIRQLHNDIQKLKVTLKEQGVPIPQEDFVLEEAPLAEAKDEG